MDRVHDGNARLTSVPLAPPQHRGARSRRSTTRPLSACSKLSARQHRALSCGAGRDSWAGCSSSQSPHAFSPGPSTKLTGAPGSHRLAKAATQRPGRTRQPADRVAMHACSSYTTQRLRTGLQDWRRRRRLRCRSRLSRGRWQWVVRSFDQGSHRPCVATHERVRGGREAHGGGEL
eukprot:COSAG01_NODE_3892_length_5578_cov_5.863296_3_plen_176_part_00